MLVSSFGFRKGKHEQIQKGKTLPGNRRNWLWKPGPTPTPTPTPRPVAARGRFPGRLMEADAEEGRNV